MTVLAFVSARARDRVVVPAAGLPLVRGRHAAPVVWASPGPLAGRSRHLRVYHPALTPEQRRHHLSSLMSRSACAMWSGLASAPLATAAIVTAATGSESAPTFAAATLAACASGVAAWYRAGHGARAVT